MVFLGRRFPATGSRSRHRADPGRREPARRRVLDGCEQLPESTLTLEYERSRGEIETRRTPLFTATATFLAFVLAGWAPLLPYTLALEFEGFLAAEIAFPVSLAAAASAFFLVGASRTIVTDRAWHRAGGEMLAVGMLAAGVAYTVGSLLGGLA